MKKFFSSMALPCLFMMYNVTAQVKPLTIGDKFPDIEFNNLIRYSKGKLKISDFKGKLVILDFWSSVCGECIAGMPKMGKLQKQFGDQIRILPIWSTEGKYASKDWYKKADSVWVNNPSLYKASKLPTILDTVLKPYVRHLPGVAFQIWIDGKGIIRGITTSDYVNEKEITKMLKGEIPNWRIFKKIEYDYNEPLVHIDLKHGAIDKTFYSAATKHKEYVWPRIVQAVDSIKGIKRFLGVNLFIKDLYSICYQNLGQLPYESMFRIETRDSSKFYQLGKYYEEWWGEGSYCFEKIAPMNTPDSIFYLSMKEELDGGFEVKSFIDYRKVDCLILKEIEFEGQHGGKSPQSSIEDLLLALNPRVLDGKKLIVADEKLLKKKREFINPKIDYYDYNNLSKVNTALKKVGLCLEESTQTVPLIVLKDINSK